MKILSGLVPEVYTLVHDAEVSLTLKPLTAAERLDIIGCANDAKKFGHAMQQACEYAITEWKGFKDAAGKDVAFGLSRIRELPVDVLIEVAQHVLNLARAGDEVKKTSGSQSPS
ncbi:MAG: hypothetical protein WBR29_10820 [Gammaproteobacteria bacterium]